MSLIDGFVDLIVRLGKRFLDALILLAELLLILSSSIHHGTSNLVRLLHQLTCSSAGALFICMQPVIFLFCGFEPSDDSFGESNRRMRRFFVQGVSPGAGINERGPSAMKLSEKREAASRHSRVLDREVALAS